MEYENSLKFKNPEMSAQWHPSLNGKLTPEDFTTGSNKKVWWNCNKGHEWLASINKRCHGRGCPYCTGNKVLQGETDLETVNPTLAKEWHPTKNEGLNPTIVTAYSNKKVWWNCNKGHEWLTSISKRSLGCGCPYCSGNKVLQGETDLVTVNPTLAKEWHPTKNEGFNPKMVTASSKKKVWWKCQHGHEWASSIASRNNNHGCPYCSGKLAIPGKTDLLTANLNLASEWHPVKNGKLKPTMVTAGSGKKVWWQCSQGHEWQATIGNRNYGNGCPYCSGKLAIPGKTDLATVNPKLASEWHLEKNENLKPTMVTAGSVKKVWWKCSEGHEWQATIGNRNYGKGCPYCSGKLAISGKTDLTIVNPKLAREWHPVKNGNLKPTVITAGSNKKVWWHCHAGHEWQAIIRDRNYGNGCPYCFGRLAIPGKTDLLTVNLNLAREWHPVKNRELKPTMVTPFSNKKVWWQCSQGHEWQATIGNRNYGKGCPYCSCKRMASVKNGKIKPEMVTDGSK